jgi:PmbA protein
MVENKGGDRMNIESILERTTKVQWEVYVQHSQRTDLQLRQDGTEARIEQENTGYGVRVIVPRTDGAGVGFASCNSAEEFEVTARKAHELAKLNRSPFFELPTKKPLPAAEAVDRKILRDPDAAARDYAEAAQAIMSDEKDISLTFGKVRTYVVDTQIMNNHGLSCKSKGTYVYLEMTFKVGNGSNPTEFWPTRYARRISDLSPTKIIPEWLKIARTCLKRHPPTTKEATVIFSPSVVCDIFVPTIGFHASAEAVEQNLSQFKEADRVSSEQLTVSDDGLYPYGLRTNSFDDEGQPQQRTEIIEGGVFKNYIYDQLHAHTMHAKPTGNSIRPRAFATDVDERYQVLPANTTTNLSIKPGHQSLDELIRDVKEGIMIYQGAWINPDEITTRFGTEIRNAQEIVNGELGEGIVGGTLSGSALDLIKKVTGLSDNAEVVSGYAFGCVAPYMRFDHVQISGPS